MFDFVWVGEDDEKAIHLANLQKSKETGKGKNDTCSSYSKDDGRELPF